MAIFAYQVSQAATIEDYGTRVHVFPIIFSMSDEALKSYFADSQKAGARLVMRRLINNSFTQTKNKTMELGISFDIYPGLFEKYKVDVVPVIVIDDKKRG
ncbi:type-F conjugative transfer system pilin assembly protein TrbC [Orientia tsutsugamushi]|uniref:Type-F conjugative transfer system pilin assembly protein TrbC n=1 Tax=Orientia tsutsugamushi TaxID=784 RepID=A0A2R8F228_ORITS|nr:type-F conjugative transfer system pilin assembly protein TrbC [Orientia tsutsugamushi]